MSTWVWCRGYRPECSPRSDSPLSGMVAYTGETCLPALLRSRFPPSRTIYTGFVAGNRLLPTDHSYPLCRRRQMVACVVTLKITGLYLPTTPLSELRLEIRLRVAVTRSCPSRSVPKASTCRRLKGSAGPGVSPVFPQPGYLSPLLLDRMKPTVYRTRVRARWHSYSDYPELTH